MGIEEFWDFIEQARARAADSTDAEEIAHEATVLLATHESQRIVSTEQILSELMAASYQAALWDAAYVINGGCSDTGFDYFRGRLITQAARHSSESLQIPTTWLSCRLSCSSGRRNRLRM
ncbi:DUF4240 domain-containing protein [Streptomyces phaeochromogenes]|uniref:DUF4240 domain-containing protein n=1 Tax=Streptomyces phaeochromogenes TaxID=1923 RepID=UPI0033D457E4